MNVYINNNFFKIEFWNFLVEIFREREKRKMKKRYITLEYLLERDISKMGLFDISRSSNYLSEIYQKWIWLIYLARVITQARYIENGFGWYISLSNYSSEIYRKWIWLIYLTRVITRAGYIEKWIWLIYRCCSHDILDFSSTKSWEQNDRLITV